MVVVVAVYCDLTGDQQRALDLPYDMYDKKGETLGVAMRRLASSCVVFWEKKENVLSIYVLAVADVSFVAARGGKLPGK